MTVQQTLEEGLSTILRVPVTIMGAGRTDTGVHAKQMFAHFDILDKREVFTLAGIENDDQLCHKLNRYLSPSIAIHSLHIVPPEAHTRFDATTRTYRYKIGTSKDPFTTDLVYTCRYDLDMDAMKIAAKILLDYTDFECFSKSNTEVNNYLCTITEAYWEAHESELHFIITANRFLRNMVRAIVGTLIEIGRAKQPASWIHEVIRSKDRSLAGASAPAHGLYLERVTYPPDIMRVNGRD